MGAQSLPPVAVLGAGVSGLAALNLLADRGRIAALFSQGAPSKAPEAPVVVDADPVALAEAIRDFAPGTVVLSPGIPPHSDLVRALEGVEAELTGEVQLAWDLTHRLDGSEEHPAWLCVTGTNGKTTTTGMLSSILQAAGKVAPAVGNIGFPITEAVRAPADVFAVELSSFQLATLRSLGPLAAICLNIDADHLDWHGSWEDYYRSKARVYDGVTRARVFFEDEPLTRKMAEEAADAENSALVPLVFGDVPEGSIGTAGTSVFDRAFDKDVAGETLVDLSKIPLIARSGLEDPGANPLVRDALAAIALARAAGVPAEAIEQGLLSFTPQGHRRADVDVPGAVTWVNDSKATNVHAAAAAAATVAPGRLIWLVGGDAKGQDLSPLFELAASRAKAIVLLGADTSNISKLAQGLPKHVLVLDASGPDGELALRNAVRASADLAAPGDTVLLAPGCASWDQFASYEQRGKVFEDSVQELQVQKGD